MALIQTQQDTQREPFVSSFTSQYLRLSNDFQFGLGDFSNSGSNISYGTDPGNHPGIVVLSTATSATTITRIGCGTSAGLTSILFGYGAWKFETQLFVTDLSVNATNAYFVVAGFTDGSTVTDGCYFRYTDTENNGNWQAVTVSNNTATITDTGVAVVAGTWYELTVIVNATGTSAAFYINNTLVSTITTNIPTGTGRQTGVNIAIVKTVGTTARLLNIDYLDVICKFTTSR